jgi:hypothetical protein
LAQRFFCCFIANESGHIGAVGITDYFLQFYGHLDIFIDRQETETIAQFDSFFLQFDFLYFVVDLHKRPVRTIVL